MGWEQFTDPATSLKQWVDAELAGLWFQRAADLTTPDELARLDGASWAEQMQAVRDAWQALAYGFQALDLPAVAQPYYVINAITWLGSCTGNDPSSARRQTVNHLVLRSPVSPQSQARFATRIVSWWTSLGNPAFTNDRTLNGVFVRINLTNQSTVASQCISPLGAHDPSCDFGGIGGGCSNGPTIHGCQQAPGYNWRTMSWNAPPQFTVGAAGAVPVIDSLSPPLRWSMEQASELAQRFSNQGPLETVAQALRWATASNIASAANAGLLPTDLVTANQQLISQYNNAVATQRGAIAAFGAVLGTVVGIMTANPVVGGVVGSVLAALAAIAPIAVGCDEDWFGRCKPVLEVTSISGTPTKAPTQVIPLPSGATRSQYQISPQTTSGSNQPPPTPPTTTPTERAGLVIGGLTLVALIVFAMKGKI